MLRRKALLSLLLVALALALVPTVLAAATRPAPRDAGTPAIGRSGDTGPLFVARGLAIGSRVRSSVTIQNIGAAPGRFTLEARANGSPEGRDVSVVVTRAADGAVIFSGPLSAAGAIDVGALGPHSEARFRLEVVVGAGAATPGRALSVSFHWQAPTV